MFFWKIFPETHDFSKTISFVSQCFGQLGVTEIWSCHNLLNTSLQEVEIWQFIMYSNSNLFHSVYSLICYLSDFDAC